MSACWRTIPGQSFKSLIINHQYQYLYDTHNTFLPLFPLYTLFPPLKWTVNRYPKIINTNAPYFFSPISPINPISLIEVHDKLLFENRQHLYPITDTWVYDKFHTISHLPDIMNPLRGFPLCFLIQLQLCNLYEVSSQKINKHIYAKLSRYR